MAKQLEFESPQGVYYQGSYWIVTEINIKPLAKKALIVFSAWANKEARDSIKAQVGDRQYRVSGDVYEQYFSASILEKSSIISQAYKLASEIKDLGAPPWNPGDPDNRTCFFEKGKDC